MAERTTDAEVLAQELEKIGDRIVALEARIAIVEEVIPRLEVAAQTTARGMEEISSHWDAVYRAMRRAEWANRRADPDVCKFRRTNRRLVVVVNKTITAVTVSL